MVLVRVAVVVVTGKTDIDKIRQKEEEGEHKIWKIPFSQHNLILKAGHNKTILAEN